MKSSLYLWAILAYLLQVAITTTTNSTLYAISEEEINLIGRPKEKPIFPAITTSEIFGAILIPIIAGLTNSVGVGGSEIQFIIIAVLFNHSPDNAVPYIQILKFSGVLGTVFLRASMREPKYGRPLVRYEILIAAVPIIFVGSKLGKILNIVVPELVPVLLLIYSSTKRIRKLYPKVRDQQKKAVVKEKGNKEMINDEGELEEGEIETAANSRHSINTSLMSGHSDITAVHLDPEDQLKVDKLLKSEQRLFPWEIFAFLFAATMANFSWELMKGTSSRDSIVNVEYCTGTYWIFYAMDFITCFLFYFIGRVLLKRKEKSRNVVLDEVTKRQLNIVKNTRKIAKAAFISGLINGTSGLGGALNQAPSMISWGLTPLQATSTASFSALFTTMTSTFTTLYSEAIPYKDIAFLMGLSFFGSMIIANSTIYLVKKWQIEYVITRIVFGLLTVLACFAPIYGVYMLATDFKWAITPHPLC